MKLAECLHTLFEQVSAVSRMTDMATRERYLVALFNHNPDTDLRLLEAVKLLMTLHAVTIYDQLAAGQLLKSRDAWALFTRVTSRTPHELFTNHINCIGDSARLQPLELSLLGLTLGIQVKVFRLQETATVGGAEQLTAEGEELDDHVMGVYPDSCRSAAAADSDSCVLVVEQLPGQYSVLTCS